MVQFFRYMKIKSAVGKKQIIIRTIVTLVTIAVLLGGATYAFFFVSSLNSCTATYIRHSDGQTTAIEGCGD